MKKEELLDLITEFKPDDAFVEEALGEREGAPVRVYEGKRSPMRIVAPIAACLAVFVAAGIMFANVSRNKPAVEPAAASEGNEAVASDEEFVEQCKALVADESELISQGEVAWQTHYLDIDFDGNDELLLYPRIDGETVSDVGVRVFGEVENGIRDLGAFGKGSADIDLDAIYADSERYYYYTCSDEADKRVESIQSVYFDGLDKTIYDDVYLQKHTSTSPWNGETVEKFYSTPYHASLNNPAIEDPHSNELFDFARADFLWEAHELPNMEQHFCVFTADEIAECENYLIEEYGLTEYADKLTPGIRFANNHTTPVWHVLEIDIDEDGETELLISLHHYVNLKGTFVFEKNDGVVECVAVFDAEEELFDPEGITRYNGPDGQFWYAWTSFHKGGRSEFSNRYEHWLTEGRLYKLSFDGENLSTEMLLSHKYDWDDNMYDIIGETYWIGDKEVTESEYKIEWRKYPSCNLWNGGQGGSIGFDLKFD